MLLNGQVYPFSALVGALAELTYLSLTAWRMVSNTFAFTNWVSQDEVSRKKLTGFGIRFRPADELKSLTKAAQPAYA